MKDTNYHIIELLYSIVEYKQLPICRVLSLALDTPEIFDISDAELMERLVQYSDTLQFDDTLYEDDEEDSY